MSAGRRLPWGLVVVIALWIALSLTRTVDPLFLPNPFDVLRRFVEPKWVLELLHHLVATLYRLAVGFAIGASVGVPVGLAMGYSTRIYAALEAVVEVLRAIPVIALFPLFLIIFGLGDASKFSIAAWSSSLIILINTMYGVQQGKQTRRMVARSLRATEWQVFSKVVFPDALPEIFVGLRTGVSIALIVVLMSEMFLGTGEGLGQLIFNAHLMYDIPSMYAGIIVAGMSGYGINRVLLSTERTVVHWKGR
jgi:NitT/TauT family transport system permease protein